MQEREPGLEPAQEPALEPEQELEQAQELAQERVLVLAQELEQGGLLLGLKP